MNACNVNSQLAREREQRSYISGLATGQRMTSRYSQREGAPLQERGWAGGNEGCWATARPAAPPSTPAARGVLAKSTGYPLLSPFAPPCPRARTLAPSSPLSRPGPRGAIRRFTPAILPTDVGLILRHPSSCASCAPLFPFNSELLCPPMLYRVLLSHSLFLVSFACKSRTLRVSSSRIFRLAPLIRQQASGDFYARSDIFKRVNALVPSD